MKGFKNRTRRYTARRNRTKKYKKSGGANALENSKAPNANKALSNAPSTSSNVASGANAPLLLENSNGKTANKASNSAASASNSVAIVPSAAQAKNDLNYIVNELNVAIGKNGASTISLTKSKAKSIVKKIKTLKSSMTTS